MKKFVMGLVVGLVLMMSGQLYAASPLVGKKVANTASVQLNGKSIGTGIIVDSITYLPVRSIANAMDLHTNYQGGVVALTGDENAKKAAEEQAQAEALTAEFNKRNSKYFDLLTQVESLQTLVKGYAEKFIPEWEKKLADQPNNVINQITLDRYKTECQQKKAELSARQTDLTAAKADVDAFVAEHPDYEKFIAKLPTP